MNRNLKILDKFDRDNNIYELICELSERAHKLISGTISSGKTSGEEDIVEAVMEEKVMPLVAAADAETTNQEVSAE